jgi:TetR/AcrR family transcriptional repressor of nem operon
MKVSKEVSERHREALLAAASRLVRLHGFEGVSIADIAAEAGLTHGAFYTHFDSKEALCAEVVEQAIADMIGRVESTSRRKRVEQYLSVAHARNRGVGCPLTALSGDVVRASPAVGAVFARGLDHLVDRLAVEEEYESGSPDRDRAIVALATRVGALLLARAAQTPKLRDEILSAAKTALLASPRQ